MCRKVTCQSCQKPSWKGCGAHVEQVLHDVPVAERCSCEALPSKSLFQRLMRR